MVPSQKSQARMVVRSSVRTERTEETLLVLGGKIKTHDREKQEHRTERKTRTRGLTEPLLKHTRIPEPGFSEHNSGALCLYQSSSFSFVLLCLDWAHYTVNGNGHIKGFRFSLLQCLLLSHLSATRTTFPIISFLVWLPVRLQEKSTHDLASTE